MITNIEYIRNPTSEEYNNIKKYFNSDIGIDKVLVYKIRLCGNLVDRDLDSFTANALKELASKMIGVIGIKNHEADVDNVHSRLYNCYTEIDKSRTNEFGEPLEFVVGEAYTIVSDGNEKFVDGLSAGLFKEVSIGFKEGETLCSICGKPSGSCGHEVGKIYENEMCIRRINGVEDAYEWSFVPIPAQLECGVVKRFQYKKEVSKKMKGLKALILKAASSLPSEEASELLDGLNENTEPETEEVKALKEKIEELETKLKGYEAGEDGEEEDAEEEEPKTIEDVIAEIVDGLNPVNDTMRQLGCKAIADKVSMGEDGVIAGAEEAKKMLEGEEYKPLFKPADSSSEIEEEQVDEKAEEMEQSGTAVKGFKATTKPKFEQEVEKKSAEPKFTKTKSSGKTGIFKAANRSKYEEV